MTEIEKIEFVEEIGSLPRLLFQMVLKYTENSERRSFQAILDEVRMEEKNTYANILRNAIKNSQESEKICIFAANQYFNENSFESKNEVN
jgi:hypothetical protein